MASHLSQEKGRSAHTWASFKSMAEKKRLSKKDASIRGATGLAMLPERALRLLTEYSWFYLYGLWVIAFVTAIAGFAMVTVKVDGLGNTTYNVYGLCYKAAQALLLNVELGPLPANPFLAAIGIMVPVLTFVTAAAVLLSIFKERADSFLIRYRYKGHVVVCGLGTKGWLFVKDFRKRGYRVVVIEKEGANPMIDEAKQIFAMVLIGNADERDVLARANIQSAAQLICVCGEDGVNAEIAALAQEIVQPSRIHALSCLAHIFSPRLGTLLRGNLIERGYELYRVDFFNVFRNAARGMLDVSQPFSAESLAGSARPHIVIVGLGWFGECLLLEAAKEWYTDHYKDKEEQAPLYVTVIDKEASRLTGYLCSRYPSLSKVCEIFPLDMDVESCEFHDAQFLSDEETVVPVTQAYVCLFHATLGPDVGMTLARNVGDNQTNPVIVATDFEWGLPKLMPEGVRFYGIFDSTCCVAALDHAIFERLAKAIHARYLETMESDRPLWDELSEEIKESNRGQATHVNVKLQRVGCRIVPRTDWKAPLFEFASQEEIDFLAEMEHDRWWKHYKKMGWHHGTVKDEKAKTHPYMIPWEELKGNIQKYDKNFVTSLPEMLESVDLDIQRVGKIQEDGPPEQ